MAYSVIYNPELKLIETKAQGKVGLREAREIITELGSVAKQNKCYLSLSDTCGMSLALSTLQIYDMPRMFAVTLATMDIDARMLKRAIVMSGNVDDFNFFETVTINSGQIARLFCDRQKALEWLLESRVAQSA